MAQRSARPRRTAGGSAMLSLRPGGRAGWRLADAKEARTGPVHPGDPGGNLAERGIALPIVFEPGVEHEDTMGFPGPFTHQPGAGFEHDAGIEDRRALCFDLSDESP